jgi:hypothetical protein
MDGQVTNRSQLNCVIQSMDRGRDKSKGKYLYGVPGNNK